ncbi:hypothetical protein GCM10009821_26780 [Aeromicrobium halocynthiae]|uniref:Uncharacterized protein n=1 Tax=Aeromicrobium halocynthiae TaxID=560557 RepID=A0ABN2W8W5_9ACTN
MGPEQALLVVTAAHLGFQLTVSAVVYPALADVADDLWPRAHAAHSRRIAALVVLVYGALLLVLGWALVVLPLGTGLVLAVCGSGSSLLTTVAVAAPTHGRLGGGRTPELVRRLLRADRVRTVGATVALVGALLV